MNFKRQSNSTGCHRFRRDSAGFTLLELMISSAIFIVLIAVASGTFISAIRTQRTITNLSEAMNNASFVIEQISREIRVGFQFTGGGNSLQFINSDGDAIEYRFIDNGIQRNEASSGWETLTSEDVNIGNAEFILQGHNPSGMSDGEPTRVTIVVSVVGEKNIAVNLQTTISSRNLDS